MIVKHLIEELEKYDADDTIIVNWWDRAWFVDWTEMNLTDEQWELVVRIGDDVLNTNELGQKLLDVAMKELSKYGNRDNA